MSFSMHIPYRYYKKILTMTFKNDLEGRNHFKIPRLMPAINRGGYFSLTEAVVKTVSQNLLTETGRLK